MTLRRCVLGNGDRRGDQADRGGRANLPRPPTMGNTGLLESPVEPESMQRRLGSPRLSHWGSYLPHSSGKAASRPPRSLQSHMMEGAPVEDISDRFLDAISRLEAVADAVTPHDAYRQLDETSMQVFWRTWPGISSWAGSLWRLLNEELMDPANSSTDLDADEVGGSG
jgi:hypothetical protein